MRILSLFGLSVGEMRAGSMPSQLASSVKGSGRLSVNGSKSMTSKDESGKVRFCCAAIRAAAWGLSSQKGLEQRLADNQGFVGVGGMEVWLASD
jgi:hypothetical protein